MYGYYLSSNNNSCKACASTCGTCFATSTNCTTCSMSHFLNNNNICTHCNLLIPFCVSCMGQLNGTNISSVACLGCVSGMYAYENKCK